MSSPLPPGSVGLPGLGETLTFLKDPYAFVKERFQKHGPVFKTGLFGRKTAVLVGADGATDFIDAEKVERLGSQPDPIYRLFAGPSLPHLDGEAHRDRKKVVLQAFTREALATYLPGMQTLLRERLAQWAGKPEVSLVVETKTLALQAVARDMMGLDSPEELARLEDWYRDIARGLTSLPFPIPGTPYGRGLAAVEAVLAFFRQVIAEHRGNPKADGLSRILACEPFLTDDQAARELHHLMLAGRVVYAHLLTVVLELSHDKELATRLQSELPAGDLTLESIQALPTLRKFLTEVKRATPVVPGMFGRARVDFQAGGFRIPKGWQILFGLRQSLMDAKIFPNPQVFDPERFGEDRQEDKKHIHALVPHGPGQPETSHHCAGTDYASLLTNVFTILMLREYKVDLPTQRLAYNWSQLTPDPLDGLRARFRPV